MILKTERLLLRKMTWEDLSDLAEILQDPLAMTAYEHAFDEQEVRQWLERQLGRYQRDGFGLWAVESRANGDFLGQVGLTKQDCEGEELLEVGYLLKRKHWHNGYATEAAMGCRDYAFEKLLAPEVFSIIRDTNYPSQRVAARLGMKKIKNFVKFAYGADMPHFLYRVIK